MLGSLPPLPQFLQNLPTYVTLAPPSSASLKSSMTSLTTVTSTVSSACQPPPNLGTKNSSKPTKRQQKVSESISPENIRIKFLQTELSAAQTRIIQLDAKVIDLEQRITVLKAMNKVLEEKQLKDTLNKYFPTNTDLKTDCPNHDLPSFQSRCPASQCQCIHSRPLCTCHSQQQPQPSSVPDLPTIVKDLLEQVSEIAKDTKLLKIAIKKLELVENNAPPDKFVDDSAQDQNKTTNGMDESAHPNPSTSPSPNLAQNESIASVEEFIGDVDESSSNHLNSQVPTIQH